MLSVSHIMISFNSSFPFANIETAESNLGMLDPSSNRLSFNEHTGGWNHYANRLGNIRTYTEANII